ncbi:response regulator transcription factor [Paenibacillus allorhizosphaerae]|uniref:Heme response regulator HssR n=1 Tax=Paenibacillus allorhizosphaerae TaxID=2849866 RepID=A0ABM8VI28_9BACL|nr:response regulator transcription factor [Paenibacillus allorhizosphaerae]CAG7643431.1 Heme response regulator HssR [Paenibacillus allorhizosphaerae]
MTRILIADDDPHIRELVQHFLTREGYQVLEAADGAEALERLETDWADLAVIDVMMPNMDGWQLCRELREHYDMPVLMLTAKGETRDKVKGFDLGAEDYLVKPFDPPELIVRVRALLKRYRIAASQTVQAGGLIMNRATFELNADGKSLTLPLKEFELLFRLASCPGVTCARETLLEQIWGFDYEGNERTLDVHINRLREKFPEDRHSFRVKTIRGLGYRLEVKA